MPRTELHTEPWGRGGEETTLGRGRGGASVGGGAPSGVWRGAGVNQVGMQVRGHDGFTRAGKGEPPAGALASRRVLGDRCQAT